MNKQIEEMAKVLVELPILFSCKISIDCLQCNYFKEIGCQTKLVAEALYNAGYRKVEDIVEKVTVERPSMSDLLNEEMKELLKPILEQTRKETAREILILAIQLSDVCRDSYEFQNRLIDLIETIYGLEVETKTIIPEKHSVEEENNNGKNNI